MDQIRHLRLPRAMLVYLLTVSLLIGAQIVAGAPSTTTPTATTLAYLPLVVAPGQPPLPGGLPAELVGTWFNGSVLNLQFYDRATGIWSDAGGLGHMYVFAADGSYTLVSHLKLGAGTTCESSVAKYQTGTARADGGRLLLTPSYARTRTQVCTPGGDSETEGPYVTAAIPWRLGEDAQLHTKLWLTEPQGETEFYRDGLGGQVVGSWYSGDGGAIELYDHATGLWADPSGESSEWYEITAVGTYRHGEINAGFGDDPCRLVTMSYEVGTVTGRGSELTLQPTGALRHMVSLCDPDNVTDSPGSIGGVERWGWGFTQQAQGLMLELVRLDTFRQRFFFPLG